LSRLLEPLINDWFVDSPGHLGFQKDLDAFQVSVLPAVWGFQSHLGGSIQKPRKLFEFQWVVDSWKSSSVDGIDGE